MKTFIGRSTVCKVKVPSFYKKVSRQHAVLEVENGQYFITDLGSRNGTLLNGNKILANQRYTIRSTDKIVLGDEYALDWPTVLSAFSGKEPQAAIPVSPQKGENKITIYAGFWRRFVAALIDSLITFAFTTLIFLVFGFSAIADLQGSYLDANSVSKLALGGIISLICMWLYFAFFESGSWQATLGKKAMGLKVTDLDSNRISFARATGRFFAKILSNISLSIGYIMAGFTSQKQALHDVIAETLVYKEMDTL